MTPVIIYPIHFSLKIPPVLEDLGERIKDYIVNPERLSIHSWERSQGHWHRESNLNSLFRFYDDFDPDTTLEVISREKILENVCT